MKRWDKNEVANEGSVSGRAEGVSDERSFGMRCNGVIND